MTEEQANELLERLYSLRKQTALSKSNKDVADLKLLENVCIQTFSFLITKRTGRYKKFANHEDLNQEGMLGLVKAINTYNPKMGSFFYWARQHINTRISRGANAHSVIKYPMHFAKENQPHREQLSLHQTADTCDTPDVVAEFSQLKNMIQNSMTQLTKTQKWVITNIFGVNGSKPISVNKFCQKTKMPRYKCNRIMRSAINLLRRTLDK